MTHDGHNPTDAGRGDRALDDLIAAASIGTLDERGIDELMRRLADDPDAQRRYARTMLLANELQWELSRQDTAASAGPVAEPAAPMPIAQATPSRSTPAAWRWGGALAAALLIGAVAVALYVSGVGMSDEPAEPAAVVGTLIDAGGAVWASEPIAVGDVVRAGELELTDGRIELETLTGVALHVRGPAAVRLEGPDTVTVTLGEVAARVPPAGVGFRVHTPGVEVVDLGTEFGVAVEPTGLTRLRVQEGSVELRFADGRREIVTAGAGWSVTANGEAVALGDGAAGLGVVFVRDREQQAERWRAFVRELTDDESVAAHYTFGGSGGIDGLTDARGADGLGVRTQGVEFTDGRLLGARALRFTGGQAEQHAVLGKPAAWDGLFNDSFSVSVWFRVDRFAYPFHTLVMEQGRQWRVVRNNDGRTLVFNTGWAGAPTDGLAAQTPVDDGAWHLATVTVHRTDRGRITKRIYIDGALEGESTGPAFGAVRGPVWLGYNPDNNLSNTFDGAIDEVIVHRRALDADDVARLYDDTRPLTP